MFAHFKLMNRGKYSKCSLRDLFFSRDKVLEIVIPKSTESLYSLMMPFTVILDCTSKERLFMYLAITMIIVFFGLNESTFPVATLEISRLIQCTVD